MKAAVLANKMLLFILVMVIVMNIAPRAQNLEYVSSSLWTYTNDVKVVDNYAFCVFKNGHVVFDISNQSAPLPVWRYYTPGTANCIAVQGDYAFLADGSGELSIFDISNPESPTLIGSSEIDIYVRDISITGIFAFLTGYSPDAG